MNKPKITIIDYQASNLRSVQKALEANGAKAEISDKPEIIAKSDAIVFPGQGAIDPSMKKLNEKNLIEVIQSYISSNKPFLGICLGLQLLFESSDEGEANCLGVLEGKSKLFPKSVKTPHMGWNQIQINIQTILNHICIVNRLKIYQFVNRLFYFEKTSLNSLSYLQHFASHKGHINVEFEIYILGYV